MCLLPCTSSVQLRQYFVSGRQQQQDTQCTYDVTLWCFRPTSVAVEKQYLLHILSVCLLPQVSNIQRVYAMLPSLTCPAVLHFPHYLTKGTFSKKKTFIEYTGLL